MQIIEYADLALAFWDGESRGTAYVIRKCREMNVPCKVYNLAKVLMNSYFQMALQHTAFFTLISVGTAMLLSVFLTFFLANSSYKLHAPFMLPVLLPTVAVCLIWNVLFGRGSLLESLGIPVEASLYTLFLWKNTGLQVVFLLSALAQLPREPMEAAAIDGAGTLGRFW